jgi:hypothetical protein
VNSFVIDASVALAWCFDAATAATRAQLDRFEDDASYLELARRRGVPLAAIDSDLVRADRRVGVSLLPSK